MTAGSMDALIAIALLCQIPGTKVGIKSAEKAQKKCQKYYVQCLEKAVQVDDKKWVGPLKECVLNRP